jgi:hypothetical protein
MKHLALLLVTFLAACGTGRVAPEPPRVPTSATWLAPDVRAFTSMGEPMFAVDGRIWMWRERGWMVWEDHAGWRWADAPVSLDTSRLEGSRF